MTATTTSGGPAPAVQSPPFILSGRPELVARVSAALSSALLTPAPGASVAVLVRDADDPDTAAAVELLGRALICTVGDTDITWGPVVGTGCTLTFADLVGRHTAAAGTARLVSGASTVGGGLPDRRPAWSDALFARALDALTSQHRAGGVPCTEHELVFDRATETVTRHLVLPLPFRPPSPEHPAGGAVDPEELLDARTGIVTRLRRIQHHPSIPAALATVQAHVTNMRRISPWLTDPVTAGSSFGNPDAAAKAAFGEAVERYSGEIVQVDTLRHATYEELVQDGEHPVDVDCLVLFSPTQYATAGFPFVPLTKTLRIHWCPGWSATRRRRSWLPASLVYPNWYTGGFEHDPHTNNPFYPGLAAGPNLDFALAAGVQEVIERHATMVWWANAVRLPGVVQTPRLQALWRGEPTRRGQRAWLVHLDNEFGVPVFAGMLENTEEQLFSMGFAARARPVDAALKAWAEAITLQDGARDLLRPDGGYRQSVSRGDVNGRFMKPWRQDRHYLDDYRTDFRDAVDLMSQMQVHLDPRALERIRSWVDVPAERDLADVAGLPDGSFETYQRIVEARGYEIFYADVTTHDVSRSGMRVVRVLIPGLVPNFAAAFPFQGLGRLRQAAVELGWRDKPLAEAEINIFPMAHA